MPSRRFLIVLFSLALAALTAGAASHYAIGREVENTLRRRKAILARPIDELRAGPFVEVIAQLSAKSNCPIDLDMRSVEAASIDGTAPISQHLFDLSLEEALRITLEQVGGATRLSWHWRGDTIVVTTTDVACGFTVLRVYEIGDLLNSMEWQEGSTDHDGSFFFGGSGPAPATPTVKNRADRFRKLVTHFVAPEPWRYAGGTIGSIVIVQDRMLVIETPNIQLQVVDLLRDLRNPRVVP